MAVTPGFKSESNSLHVLSYGVNDPQAVESNTKPKRQKQQHTHTHTHSRTHTLVADFYDMTMSTQKARKWMRWNVVIEILPPSFSHPLPKLQAYNGHFVTANDLYYCNFIFQGFFHSMLGITLQYLALNTNSNAAQVTTAVSGWLIGIALSGVGFSLLKSYKKDLKTLLIAGNCSEFFIHHHIRRPIYAAETDACFLLVNPSAYSVQVHWSLMVK